ncbi:MAG: PDDEXK nuclease domain-containing protein [Burkholderiales bacterium]
MANKKKPTIEKVSAAPKRLQRGRADRGAMFPVPPTQADSPAGYAVWLAQLKERIQQERLRVVLASNAVMVLLYWDIGRSILTKQSDEGWGSRVIDRLATDLRDIFPEMKGFSPRNLKYMRAFATAWPAREMVQQAVAQLSWRHNISLLEKLQSVDDRLWYAAKTLEHGWSSNILALQIEAQAHRRQGKAQTNFPATLPPSDSDMAVQIFKDPYLFDFLGTDAPRREAELERGLVAHIQKFLLELGQGFAFVGRQVHLEIGEDDFYLDLLFYHLKLRRYVVVELKARKFKPGDGAQLGMYMTAVDRLLSHPDDKPTLGLLLVREKNRVLVEYALGGNTNPISIAEWDTQLTHALPEELQSSLPTIEQIEAELAGTDEPAETEEKQKKAGKRAGSATRRSGAKKS